MASAGVVGMAEVVVPNSSNTGSKLAGSAAMWSLVWVGLSALFLVFVNLAMIGRAGR
jgi:hypothetical protein